MYAVKSDLNRAHQSSFQLNPSHHGLCKPMEGLPCLGLSQSEALHLPAGVPFPQASVPQATKRVHWKWGGMRGWDTTDWISSGVSWVLLILAPTVLFIIPHCRSAA